MIIKMKKLFFIFLLCFTFICFFGCKKEPNIEDVYPRNDNYYQVFVRSFADGNDDGIGDFKGLTDKLDYLKDLGITGLWLMPINPSSTYHGYDVMDYYDVNEDYGTMADFEALCLKAEEKGIKIMIDMVINHTSYLHPWFQKALAGDKEYQDYYVFTDLPTNNIKGSWGQNIYHTKNGLKYCGYFSDTMPDLNYFNEDVIEEVYKIGKFWIDKGVDGFRLDAAQHFFGDNEYLGISYDYYQNIVFLKKYREKMREYDPNFYITGEINLTAESIVKEYFRGVDSPLDFPLAKKIVDSANSNGNFYYVDSLKRIYEAYQKVDTSFISAPFLRNHDENRLANEYANNQDKLSLVAEMLLTLPGSPIIYYGEEIGMFGSKSNGEVSDGIGIWDETRRLPINFGDNYTTTWFSDESFNDVIANKNVKSVNEQLSDDKSLLSVYKALLNLRNANIALKYGNTITPYENNNTQLQGFYREFTYGKQTQKLLILHNLSVKDIKIPEINGKIIYLTKSNNPESLDVLRAKSTIIFDLSGEIDD